MGNIVGIKEIDVTMLWQLIQPHELLKLHIKDIVKIKYVKSFTIPPPN
jgi:hypothetical protein